MSSRDRQASGGVTLAEQPAPARAIAPGAERDCPAWEDVLATLSPEQRQQLLSLASAQGVLHADQLPVIDSANLQQRRQLFTHLLAGKTGLLAPLTLTPLTPVDAALDPAQAEAVARAIYTPDLYLIQGPPGAGKSRVAAEIVRQAVARGERVLLLAASAVALDRLLERVGSDRAVYPLRCLHTGETGETLPACVRPHTFEERTRSLCETAILRAREAVHRAEAEVRRREAQETAWDELAVVAAALRQVETQRAALAARGSSLPDEIQREWGAPGENAEPGSLSARASLWRGERDSRLRRITDETQQIDLAPLDRELVDLARQRERIQPLVEAWRHGRWWTPAWWKVLFNRAILSRSDDLDRREAELRQRKTTLGSRRDHLERKARATEAEFEQRRQELLAEETRRRESEWERDLASLQVEIEALNQRWGQTAARLSDCSLQPTTLDAARREWEQLRRLDQQQADFARRWAIGLEKAAPALAARLPACANLVAATPAALSAEPRLSGVTFDLLLVEEAELLPDAELLLAVKLARRWVLIGEPEPPRPASASPGRPLRPAAVSSAIFHRLWQYLHVAPCRLPVRWAIAGDRLCCRLRPVADDQRHWIDREPVADHPDIELHFLNVPRQEPALVEVHFPSTTPFRRAKEFILRELQQTAAHATGPAFLWTATASRLQVQIGTVPPSAWNGSPSLESVSPEEGVVEYFRRTPGDGEQAVIVETLGFEFDPAQGWDRERAEDWLGSQLGYRDLGHTAYLGRLHRPLDNLAAFLVRHLHRDLSWALDSGLQTLDLVPELIPVPRREANRLAPRGGAGLEIDLASNPPAERLPTEMRAALPRQGLVNYEEALAVVQTLEALLTEDAFRVAAVAWQRERLPAGCLNVRPPQNGCQTGEAHSPPPMHSPAVMVTALYDSQVQLLRLLISRSPSLARAGLVPLAAGRFRLSDGLELLVEVPPNLRQRECLTLLLSMTRSHATRAVALGAQPTWLPLALTRPAQRLYLFADVGTLTRRTQWASAVDHLDESAAARERELVMPLLQCQPPPLVASPPPLSPARR